MAKVFRFFAALWGPLTLAFSAISALGDARLAINRMFTLEQTQLGRRLTSDEQTEYDGLLYRDASAAFLDPKSPEIIFEVLVKNHGESNFIVSYAASFGTGLPWEDFLLKEIDALEKLKSPNVDALKALGTFLYDFTYARLKASRYNGTEDLFFTLFPRLKKKLFDKYKRATPTSEDFDSPLYSHYLEAAAFLGDTRALRKAAALIQGAYAEDIPAKDDDIRARQALRAAKAVRGANVFDAKHLQRLIDDITDQNAFRTRNRPIALRPWEELLAEVGKQNADRRAKATPAQ